MVCELRLLHEVEILSTKGGYEIIDGILRSVCKRVRISPRCTVNTVMEGNFVESGTVKVLCNIVKYSKI